MIFSEQLNATALRPRGRVARASQSTDSERYHNERKAMKSNHLNTAFLAMLILVVACSTDSDVSSQSIENTIPEYHLTTVDSFGVEVGDSLNMIGSITGFCYHPSGAILLLDRASMRIRIIKENDQVVCAGREGEGPGEFLIPLDICAMEDGRILVADSWKHEVMEFDLAGDYVGSFLNAGEESTPSRMYQVDSNSIVGSRVEMDLNSDPIQVLFHIGRYDSECDPSVVYEEMSFDLTSSDIYRDMELVDFCATPTGDVYIVPDNTDYRIEILSSNGDLRYLLNPEVERLPKSEEDLQLEIEEFEQGIQNGQINPAMQDFHPAPYNTLIALAGVDGDGNLWVERYDVEEGYSFDVWDSTGSIVYTAVLQDTADIPDLSFKVDQYGILGANVDSDEYPRIYSYVLEN